MRMCHVVNVIGIRYKAMRLMLIRSTVMQDRTRTTRYTILLCITAF